MLKKKQYADMHILHKRYSLTKMSLFLFLKTGYFLQHVGLV